MTDNTYTPHNKLYSEAITNTICTRLAAGESLLTICKSEGMPCRHTVYQWLLTYPDFKDKYKFARQLYTEHLIERVGEITQQMRTVKNRAEAWALREAIDAIKWQMARMASKNGYK